MRHFGVECPRIRLVKDGEPHHDDLLTLRTNVDQMCGQVNNFAAAVALHQFLQHNVASAIPDEQELIFHWRLIAARDACVRLSDFEDAFLGAHLALGRIAKNNINPVDPKPTALLERYFPDRKHLRNSAAHMAEKTKTPNQRAEHDFSGSYTKDGVNLENVSQIAVGEWLINDTYKSGWQGKIAELAITAENVERLEAIKSSFFRTIPESLMRA